MSSGAINLRSLTESFPAINLSSGESITIRWHAPRPSQVWLRGHGLRRKLYYRMDTWCSTEDTTFQWEPDVLSALSIKRADLGLLGWTQMQLNERDFIVYLPLALQQGAQSPLKSSVEAVLWAEIQLSEIFVTLAILNESGAPDEYLRYQEPLAYGFYPVARPISFTLPEMESPGLYEISVGALHVNGGSSTLSVLVYHSGFADRQR